MDRSTPTDTALRKRFLERILYLLLTAVVYDDWFMSVIVGVEFVDGEVVDRWASTHAFAVSSQKGWWSVVVIRDPSARTRSAMARGVVF